jgi:hypothetical protein
MSIDRVSPLKLESSDTGGTQNDEFPTSLNRNQDFLDARGLAIQDMASNDATTLIGRVASDMTFQDGSNPTPVTLTDLLAGGGGGTADYNKQLLEISGQLVYIGDGDIALKQ